MAPYRQRQASKVILTKLIMKSKGFNFINVLSVPFLYESLFGSFSLVTFKLREALSYKKKFVQNVDEIDPKVSMQNMRTNL